MKVAIRRLNLGLKRSICSSGFVPRCETLEMQGEQQSLSTVSLCIFRGVAGTKPKGSAGGEECPGHPTQLDELSSACTPFFACEM